MKKKITKVLITVIVITAVCGGTYYGYNKLSSSKKTTSSLNYYMVAAKKQTLNVTIQGTGQAYASVTKDIVSKNQGEIQNLSIKQGDTIKQGSTICKVYSYQLQQSLDQASINLKKAQMTLSNDQNLLTQQQAQTTTTTTQNSQGVKSPTTQITQDTIDNDTLSVQLAQKSLDNAAQQVSDMTLTSPISGTIITQNNNNGDSIQSGKAILTVMDPTSIKVKISVDELDIAKVKVGQAATLTFDAIEGKTYTGAVDSINTLGKTTNNVTSYDVVVSMSSSDGVLLGMTANVTINVESKENALTIPVEALINNNGKKYVMVPNTTSTAKVSSTTPNNNSSETGTVQKPNNTSGTATSKGSGNKANKTRSASGNYGSYAGSGFGTSSEGKLVAVTTGIKNQDFVEIVEGLTENSKVLVQIPKTNSTTNNTNKIGGFGGGNMNFGGNSKGK